MWSFAITSNGTMFVGESAQLTRIDPVGTATALPSQRIRSLAADGAGNLYGIDSAQKEILKIAADGTVTSLAGANVPYFENTPTHVDGAGADARFFCAQNIAAARDGNLYVTESCNRTVRRVTPSGVVTTIYKKEGISTESELSTPITVAVDSQGIVHVADAVRIWKIVNGAAQPFAGGGSPARDGTGTDAGFSPIKGMVFDHADNLYVTTTQYSTSLSGAQDRVYGTGTGAVRKVTPAGTVTTLAGNFAGESVISADGTGTAARFTEPMQIAFHRNGNLYLVDKADRTVRKITLEGVATTYAGR